MTAMILNYLWHDLFAWVGVCGLVMIGSGYLIVTTPFKLLREAAIIAFTVAALILLMYPKAYLDGANNVKAQVQRKEQQLLQRGDKAHADAVHDALAGVRDPWDDDGDEH